MDNSTNTIEIGKAVRLAVVVSDLTRVALVSGLEIRPLHLNNDRIDVCIGNGIHSIHIGIDPHDIDSKADCWRDAIEVAKPIDGYFTCSGLEKIPVDQVDGIWRSMVTTIYTGPVNRCSVNNISYHVMVDNGLDKAKDFEKYVWKNMRDLGIRYDTMHNASTTTASSDTVYDTMNKM